jgi:hypothetical protein
VPRPPTTTQILSSTSLSLVRYEQDKGKDSANAICDVALSNRCAPIESADPRDALGDYIEHVPRDSMTLYLG